VLLRELDGARAVAMRNCASLRLRRAVVLGHPAPGVAKPDLRQNVERAPLGPSRGRRPADADVLGAPLRVLALHVEVAVAVEDPRVEDLRLARVAPRVR